MPCVEYSFNMVSAMNQPTRMSTLVLPVDQSLNGAVVTCYAGGSTSDPQAGNLTIHIVGEMVAAYTLLHIKYIDVIL